MISKVILNAGFQKDYIFEVAHSSKGSSKLLALKDQLTKNKRHLDIALIMYATHDKKNLIPLIEALRLAINVSRNRQISTNLPKNHRYQDLMKPGNSIGQL